MRVRSDSGREDRVETRARHLSSLIRRPVECLRRVRRVRARRRDRPRSMRARSSEWERERGTEAGSQGDGSREVCKSWRIGSR